MPSCSVVSENAMRVVNVFYFFREYAEAPEGVEFSARLGQWNFKTRWQKLDTLAN